MLAAPKSEPPSQQPRAGVYRVLQTLRDEPLLHFAVLAALLFAAHALWAGDDREVITVDAATQQYLIKQKQDLLLRPLSKTEKDEVIAAFVEDEMLVREAKKRGFDNNSRVRRLLVQNMRYFYSSDLPKPTDATLKAYFEANPERFRSPATAAYDQVFFKDAAAVPKDLLGQLNAGADHTNLGDTSLTVGRKVTGVDQKALVRTFGADEARRILAIADRQWHGPFASSQGVHFLRVAERQPARQAAFARARKWIEADWRLTKQRSTLDRELAKIRQGYRVEIASSDEAAK